MSKRTAQQKSNTFTRLSCGDNRLAITSKLTKPGLVCEDVLKAASWYRISSEGALSLDGPWLLRCEHGEVTGSALCHSMWTGLANYRLISATWN